MRISDWSSDVCSSDLVGQPHLLARIGENVDQRIISLDLAVRNPADEMDLRRGGRSRRLRLERGLHRRSEEHTSELQSLMRISYAVFCLKKKKKTQKHNNKQMYITTNSEATSSSSKT